MYYLLFSLFYLVSLLPLRVLYLLSDLLCPVVRHVVRYRRSVVRQNLREAFPEKTEKQLRRIEAKFYRQLCDYFVEDLKVTSMSRRQMMRRMTFSNLELIQQLYDQGHQFVFINVGHLGNWEWTASMQYWVEPVHVAQIYHRLRSSAMDRLFLRNRQKFGGECIKMRHTLRRLVELRRKQQSVLVGFIADQQPKWNAIHHFTPFLNHNTAVFTGAEHIAKSFGAAMVYGRVTRPRRGYYHLEVVPISDSPNDHPDFELTDHYFRMLEQDILAAPHLWLWTHKRWSRTYEQWIKRTKQ